MPASEASALLHRHADEIRDWTKFIWDQYIKWFMFFAGFNFIALGALGAIGAHTNIVAAVFIMFNMLGIGSALCVLAYTMNATETLRDINQRIVASSIAEGSLLTPEDANRIILPGVIAMWAIGANFIGHVGLSIVWIVIMRRSGL